MAAATGCEWPEAGGKKVAAFIQKKYLCGVVEDFQQAIDVHEGQIIDGQEVGRARRMSRPAIGIDIENRFRRSRRAPFFDLHLAAAIKFEEVATTPQLDQARNIFGRHFAWTPNQICCMLVDNYQTYGLQYI